MTESKIARVRFLDFVYDFKPEQPGDPATVGFFFEGGRPDDEDAQSWWNVIRGLRDDGLIILHESLDLWSSSASLTDRGRDEVEQRRARREDQMARGAECRNALVRWLANRPRNRTNEDIEPFFSSPFSFYEGVRYEPAEVDEALEYLEEKGLVKGIHVAEIHRPLNPELTAEGIDCARDFDSSVKNYLRRNEGHRVQYRYDTHIHNPNASAFSIGTHGDTHQTINSGAGADDIAKLLRQTVEAASTLGLSERDAARLRTAAEAAEQELASDERDENWFAQTIRQTGQLLFKASGSATAMALFTYLRAWAESHGIPLELP